MIPLSLQGLSATTGTDPNDTSLDALTARARLRKTLYDQQHAVDVAHDPNAAQDTYFQGANDRDIGGLQESMGPFDESLLESGERQGGTTKIGGAPGLSSDMTMGTLPVSLQGLSGADYTNDRFGFPVSVSMAKKKPVAGGSY